LYLALKKINGRTHYFIRESYKDGEYLLSRDLLDLGTDPARHIIYPGGHAFYIDEHIEDSLRSKGLKYTSDELDDIFWCFLDPEVKNALESFRHRGTFLRIPGIKKEKIDSEKIHLFDRRRIHYLRYGQIDQGRIGRVSPRLFAKLINKSRDEIEQHIMAMERELDLLEFKTYVYAVFDLQRFFTQITAKIMPQGLDQNKVDRHFLEEICRLNSDRSFWAGMNAEGRLDQYLIRYAIMFFDNPYARSTFLDDHIRAYMDSKRAYIPPHKKNSTILKEASNIFGVDEAVLKKMTKKAFISLYRRTAQELHPDKGGEKEKFIKLSEAYEDLLKTKK